MNVAFCVGGCNPVNCGDGLVSYGRKKRESEAVSYMVRRDTAVESSSLVYDVDLGQEILISSTPLSKEIYVETGTKVDSIKADEGGVEGVLAGRDNTAGNQRMFSDD